ADAPGEGTRRARDGWASGEHALRVLGPLHRLAFTRRAVTLDAGKPVDLGLTGYDADGFDAPVAARDVTLDYDRAAIDVTTTPDGSIRITGRADATGTTLTATVGGVTARLPVAAGLTDESLAEPTPLPLSSPPHTRGRPHARPNRDRP
ncbi:hypothetical protein ACFFNX_47265, partial [Actinoallomurus acaciae]